MRRRIIFNLIVLAALVWLPWWLVLALFFFGLFYFPLYLETIWFSAIYALLYGTPGSFWSSGLGIFLIVSLAAALVEFFLKSRLRFFHTYA